VEEPERRGGERSEAPRSGGSSTVERRTVPSGPDANPDPEVTARRPRRRLTSQCKLEVRRTADACTQPDQLGARLRKEGRYSSHLVTWRKQRVAGLTPKKRGHKLTADPRVQFLGIPLKPFETDEIE